MAKSTELVVLTKERTLAIADNIEKICLSKSASDAVNAYTIGKGLYELFNGNVHKAEKLTFKDYISHHIKTYTQSPATVDSWRRAYTAAKEADIPEKDMVKWNVDPLQLLNANGRKAFAKGVKDGTISPPLTAEQAKALNNDGVTEVIPTFARFDGSKPVETENGIELLTEEEVKTNKPTATDKSMTVCAFTFRDNMERKVIVYANVNKANLCISSSVWYREYTSADVDAYHAKQGNDAKREARIAKLRKDGWSEEDITEMLG